jgi:hypothetical protein
MAKDIAPEARESAKRPARPVYEANHPADCGVWSSPDRRMYWSNCTCGARK